MGLTRFPTLVIIQAMNTNEILSTNEAADVIGCTGRRVLQLLDEGTLAGQRLNGRAWIVYRKSAEKIAAVRHERGRPRSGKPQ